MKEQLMDDLRLLLRNNFIITLDVLGDRSNCSLLSPKIGLAPRDLIKLISLIEKKYNIRIEENEIVNNRLDYLENLVDLLEQQL